MTKRVLFLILTIALFSFAMHKYYVSITEASYNTKSQTFDVSIKFIGHDLEAVLANAGVPELYLGTKKEHEKADYYLKRYIDNRFKMIVDGKQLTFKFIGKEVNNDDFIYCFIQSNEIKSPKKVEIKNTLLIELFNEQANKVYVKVGDQQLNYLLNKSKVSETHTVENK